MEKYFPYLKSHIHGNALLLPRESSLTEIWLAIKNVFESNKIFRTVSRSRIFKTSCSGARKVQIGLSPSRLPTIPFPKKFLAHCLVLFLGIA